MTEKSGDPELEESISLLNGTTAKEEEDDPLMLA